MFYKKMCNNYEPRKWKKKENKILHYEIEQTNKYKNEYIQLIEELKETKKKYEKTYRNLERLESEFEREKNRLKDKHKYYAPVE